MRPGEFPDSGRSAARQARKCSVNGTAERGLVKTPSLIGWRTGDRKRMVLVARADMLNGARHRRTFLSPGQPRSAVELLQRCFRLERFRLAGECLCAKNANRGVGAREFGSFTATVRGEPSCDVGRDAGVRPAIAAHEQI